MKTLLSTLPINGENENYMNCGKIAHISKYTTEIFQKCFIYVFVIIQLLVLF